MGSLEELKTNGEYSCLNCRRCCRLYKWSFESRFQIRFYCLECLAAKYAEKFCIGEARSNVS